MEDKRVTLLKDAPVRKNARYVLYWLQINKRAENNHALNFAIEQANQLRLPLLVYEGLDCSNPYACDRFHQFILENSLELSSRLKERGLRYAFTLFQDRKDWSPVLLHLAAEAALLVSDDFPAFVIPQRNARVAAKVGIPFFTVDSAGIVPMKEMTKQEYAARTIRPKIQRLLSTCLKPMAESRIQVDSRRLKIPIEETPLGKKPTTEWVASCNINHRIGPSPIFKGGYSPAQALLRDFIENKLENYVLHKNEPSRDGTSNLSPYLHFGVLSSLDIALRVKAASYDLRSTDAFLEELIVRRELSYNFMKYSDDYESLFALPHWVQQTLSRHAVDRRSYLYTCRQFECGQTHDPVWNACQLELTATGKIHGYMRMYWGKKIMEWSKSHPEALETMIYLNNQYALDGRDPNSWTSILWCFGLHDRPWGERPVFGTIRYMSGDSLKRKVNIPGYLLRVKQLAPKE
jgi:deoxyribodipyrimidine photo-lyase